MNNENFTRLGIFASVGYICAGLVVGILASIPFWTQYFESSSSLISTITVALMVVGAAVGIIALRFLLPKFGVKAVFEHDILIVMIGLLFITLAMNEAMLVVGLFVTMAALAVFFFENFKTQVAAAREGGSSILKLAGWAAGPFVVIVVLALFYDSGLLCLRLLFGHYILLGFWVWIQRLGLHMDYKDAPDSVFSMVDEVHAHEAARRREDEYLRSHRHGVIIEEAPKAAANPADEPKAAPASAPEVKEATGISVDSLGDDKKN